MAEFFTAFWTVDVWKASRRRKVSPSRCEACLLPLSPRRTSLQASRSSHFVAAEVARAWRSWACRVAPPRAGRAHKTEGRLSRRAEWAVGRLETGWTV